MFPKIVVAVACTLFLFPCTDSFRLYKAGCSFSLNEDVDNYLPLLLKPEGGDDVNAFIQPIDDEGTVTMEAGEAMKLSCPGGNVKISGTSTGKSSLAAVCKSGNSFTVAGKTAPIGSITCTKYPGHKARYSGASCLKAYKEIEIGYEQDSGFITLIKTCFDEANQNALYSVFLLAASIGGYQVGFPRPDFVEAGFYDVGSTTVDKLYVRNKQRVTINTLLGLASNDNKYIATSSDFYIARGHLTAKADFVYGANQRATFYFVNVAPQWQSFNGGNWNTLEGNVRSFANSRQLDLIVYSGTRGVTTLPHAKTGQDVELYLYVDGNKRGIAVPQLFWKVVYNPATKAGVAFVGVNNPYHENVEAERICTDICDQIDWTTWQPNNIKQGFGYCCTVDELRQAVDTVPDDFDVRSVLK